MTVHRTPISQAPNKATAKFGEQGDLSRMVFQLFTQVLVTYLPNLMRALQHQHTARRYRIRSIASSPCSPEPVGLIGKYFVPILSFLIPIIVKTLVRTTAADPYNSC